MKKNGFTLIELLVALPIGVVVLSAIVGAIFMIPRGTIDVKSRAAALGEIENAAHWLTRDIVMGQGIDLFPGAPPVNTVNMTWSDYTGGPGSEIAHYVAYTHDVPNHQLLRQYDSSDNITIAGRNLTYVGFSIDNGSLVTVTLTSSTEEVFGSAVTRTYVIQMRALQY